MIWLAAIRFVIVARHVRDRLVGCAFVLLMKRRWSSMHRRACGIEHVGCWKRTGDDL